MYRSPAIINNYRTGLIDLPKRGLRNLITHSDNVGNIVFLEAITSQISNISSVDFHTQILTNPKEFAEKHDVLILPLANMITSTWKAPGLVQFLSQFNIPIILVSVGLQANRIEDVENIEISEDATFILDRAKETSTSIGVRGEITAKLLQSRGYTTRTIGCPSSFLKNSGSISKISNPVEIYRIATHCTLTGVWRKELIDFLTFSRKYAQSYIAQNEFRFLLDAYHVNSDTLTLWLKDNPDRLELCTTGSFYDYRYYSESESAAIELQKWIRRSLIYFTDTESWISHLSNFDFVVGSRFHGTMIGLQAGVPSLLLSTDLRTQELAEYHKIPAIPLSKVTPEITPEELYEYTDFTEYEEFKSVAKLVYTNFLIENGLKPSLSFESP